MFKKLIAAALLAAACAAPASASVTISFTGGNSATNGRDGNILTFSSGGVSVQASGWTMNGNSGHANSSWLGNYANGLGVTGDSESGFSFFNQYGVDNAGSGTDFILLVFNQAVNLQSAVLAPVQTSLFSNDNDVTVGYANAANAFTTPGTAFSQNSAIWPAIWSTATTLSGNSSAPFSTALNQGQDFGNLWVISAALNNPDYYSDGFQLSSITVTGRPAQPAPSPSPSPAVPEPTTWAMMLIGFGFIGAKLRRKKTGLARLQQIA